MLVISSFRRVMDSCRLRALVCLWVSAPFFYSFSRIFRSILGQSHGFSVSPSFTFLKTEGFPVISLLKVFLVASLLATPRPRPLSALI